MSRRPSGAAVCAFWFVCQSSNDDVHGHPLAVSFCNGTCEQHTVSETIISRHSELDMVRFVVPPPLHPSVDLMRRSASSRRMASKEGKKATAGPECRVSQMHSHPVTCGSAPCLWWRGPRSWSFPVGQHAPASRMGLDRHGGFSCLLIRERGAGFLRVSPLPRTRDRFCVERPGLSDLIMSTTARTASRVQRLPATNSSNPPQAGQTAGTVGNLMDARGY